jgi:hypothetical protein
MGEISRRALMLGMAAVGATASVGAPVLAAADGAVRDEASTWAARLGGVALNAGERLECGWIRMHFGESAFLVSDRFVQATLPCRNGYDVLARGGGRVLLATRAAEHQSGHEHVPVRVIDALRRDHPQSVMKRKEADADARRNARWHSFRAGTEGAARIMRFQDDRMMVFYEMQRCENLREALEPMWVLLGESWDGMNVYEVRRGATAVVNRGID